MSKKLFASCFGLGFLPLAPGSWGSLPPVAVFIVLAHLTNAFVSAMILAALTIAASFLCIALAPAVTASVGKKDPGCIVLDEVAGQSLTFFIISFLNAPSVYTTAVAGFLLFRFFDILKLWPCRKLENLRGGWGILADDLAAAVYASVVFAVLVHTGLAGSVDKWFCVTGPVSLPMAIFLGAVQGLTEFLPVSSSGHLVLFENIFDGIAAESPQMLLFDLTLHVGTVGSIFFVYRKSIVKFVRSLIIAFSYGLSGGRIYKKSPAFRILILAIVSTFTTAIAYKIFSGPLESARRLEVVAAAWFVTAILLLAADMRKKTRIGLRRFGMTAAAVIGLAQAAAILPGLSRSGTTIAVAVLLGLRRRWAVEFSFLISIPAILGAAVLKFAQDYRNIDTATLPVSVLLAGAAAAFVVGIAALNVLIMSSRRRKLRYFAAYCCILAVFVAVYLL